MSWGTTGDKEFQKQPLVVGVSQDKNVRFHLSFLLSSPILSAEPNEPQCKWKNHTISQNRSITNTSVKNHSEPCLTTHWNIHAHTPQPHTFSHNLSLIPFLRLSVNVAVCCIRTGLGVAPRTSQSTAITTKDTELDSANTHRFGLAIISMGFSITDSSDAHLIASNLEYFRTSAIYAKVNGP